MTSQPRDWSYASIARDLRHRKILLRVHTPSVSNSSLPLDNNGTEGFASRNVAFRGLTPEQYAQTTEGMRRNRNWAEGPYMRETILNHINNATTVRSRLVANGGRGRERGGHVGRKTRFEPDEQSPWISTTGNLDWAIWYIAKLLQEGRGEVRLAIIDAKGKEVEMSLSPCTNRPHKEWLRLPSMSKEAYLRASVAANRSKERLFYGRIFGRSILADLIFTSYEMPFALPLAFWNPNNIDNTRRGWLARLRWHPALLTYEMAMDNVERPLGPKARQWKQPVSRVLQLHAPRTSEGLEDALKPREDTPSPVCGVLVDLDDCQMGDLKLRAEQYGKGAI